MGAIQQVMAATRIATPLVYATWNPSDKGSGASLSAGNLGWLGNESTGAVRATIGKSSGKWYWECTSAGARFPIIGVGLLSVPLTDVVSEFANGYAYYGLTGNKASAGVYSAYGATWASAGDVIGTHLDMDNGKVGFSKNGTYLGDAFTGLSGTFYPMAGGDTSGSTSNCLMNFGQTALSFTPSGFNPGLYT